VIEKTSPVTLNDDLAKLISHPLSRSSRRKIFLLVFLSRCGDHILYFLPGLALGACCLIILGPDTSPHFFHEFFSPIPPPWPGPPQTMPSSRVHTWFCYQELFPFFFFLSLKVDPPPMPFPGLQESLSLRIHKKRRSRVLVFFF